MTEVSKHSWLLLLYSLPKKRNTARVAVWRRFKKIGAIQVKTSTYLLPDQPAQYEHFQWLAQQIRDYGGDATLVRAQEIEGMSDDQIVQMFNQARAAEYQELVGACRSALAGRGSFGFSCRASSRWAFASARSPDSSSASPRAS